MQPEGIGDDTFLPRRDEEEGGRLTKDDEEDGNTKEIRHGDRIFLEMRRRGRGTEGGGRIK